MPDWQIGDTHILEFQRKNFGSPVKKEKHVYEALKKMSFPRNEIERHAKGSILGDYIIKENYFFVGVGEGAYPGMSVPQDVFIAFKPDLFSDIDDIKKLLEEIRREKRKDEKEKWAVLVYAKGKDALGLPLKKEDVEKHSNQAWYQNLFGEPHDIGLSGTES